MYRLFVSVRLFAVRDRFLRFVQKTTVIVTNQLLAVLVTCVFFDPVPVFFFTENVQHTGGRLTFLYLLPLPRGCALELTVALQHFHRERHVNEQRHTVSNTKHASNMRNDTAFS